jgi:hypothetical protein
MHFWSAAALALATAAAPALAQGCSPTTVFSLATSTYAASNSQNCTTASGSSPFDFSVANPLSRQFAYFASQGSQCYSYDRLGVYYYQASFSNPNGTNATQVSFAQVPCILRPCCVILRCMSSLGCPNLTLSASWSIPASPSSSSFPYQYIYYPVGASTIVGIILSILRFFGLLACICRKQGDDIQTAALAEPIAPDAANEETPFKAQEQKRAPAA